MIRYMKFAVITLCLFVIHLPESISQESNLDLFTKGYPRAFFFRVSEGFAARGRYPFEQWERIFLPLSGIEGKVLEEEVPGRSRYNIDYFTRFKERHPEKLVLLHYNGNARDPRDNTEEYFAGHWIYYTGCVVTQAVAAEKGESDIHVEDASLFRVNIGRYQDANEDIGICLLSSDGKLDWNQSEQVQLISVDAKNKIIRVRRGCYGTTPRAFPAGRAWAAAHVTEGPWGKRSHLLWFYNFSTKCPRDSRGRSCIDIYVEEFAKLFLPGGALKSFDGVEFDVLSHKRWNRKPAVGRGVDMNGDGKSDYGYFDGVNTYGIGVFEFCKRLRERLGDRKFILADGARWSNQRAFEVLNGIESEGWPHLSDPEIEDWSGGLNRHFFWDQNARKPVFNYINHKFIVHGKRHQVPFNIHRLVFAVAQFTNSAICYSYPPRPEQGELLGVWDELRMGVEHKIGWLGEPLSPPVRLALQQKDLLAGEGKKLTRDFIARWSGKDIHFSNDDGSLKVSFGSQGNKRQENLKFLLHDVPCDGPDLFVSFKIRVQPMAKYPKEIGRLVWVGVPIPEGRFIKPTLPTTGMCRRGEVEKKLNRKSGAVVRYYKAYTIKGETHSAYFVHPPYKGGTGYTFWEREAHVPESGKLSFFLGLSERAKGRSDGVTFSILASQDGSNYEKIFQKHYKKSLWQRYSVPLSKWASKKVQLKFISDSGPKDNPTTDHSLWGDVEVVSEKSPSNATEPVRFMTWANYNWFNPTFYFRRIKSQKIDLEFEVEGTEPVWLSDLSVHAHPDAIYRQFTNGLVLANPSLHDYLFDLAKLSPGIHYRKLRGSSRQDPATNDGSVVGEELRLGERDAIFLVRVK